MKEMSERELGSVKKVERNVEQRSLDFLPDDGADDILPRLIKIDTMISSSSC